MPTNAVIPLILFMSSLLALSLHALSASGHFPRKHSGPALTSGIGAIILFGSVVLAIVSGVATLIAAWRLIPWYAAVIGGGLSILAAPLILQRFPDQFVDGRCALAIFAGGGAACALLLIWLEGMALP